MPLQDFTPEQRRAYGAQAVEARSRRARVKTQFGAGELSWEGLLALAEQDPAIARLPVRQLLLAGQGWGITKVDAVLQRVQISATRRIGGLGPRQRQELGDYLREYWMMSQEHREPQVTVLAGPTSVGKSTLSRQIRQDYPQVTFSVSATTRAPRPGEVDGEDYLFITEARFNELLAADEFLEWAQVHQRHRYGTLRSTVENSLAAGSSVLLEIDLQGARQVREQLPEAQFVFLSPPSWDVLVSRLIGRGTESSEEQQRRLETAKIELAAESEFDITIINDDITRAAAELVALMGCQPQPKEGD